MIGFTSLFCSSLLPYVTICKEEDIIRHAALGGYYH